MTTTRLGLAMFTIRKLDTSLPEMIRIASEAGFDGVELVHRIHEEFDVDAVNEAFEETGLERVGVHVWLHELEDELPELIERYGAIGVDTFVVPYHPDSNFRTEARLRRLVGRLNAVAEEVDARGYRLLYHPNHWDMVPFFDGPVLGRIPTLRLTDRIPLDVAPVRQFRRVENELNRRRNRLFDHAFIRLGATDDNTVGTLVRKSPLGYIVTETDPETLNFEIDVSFFLQQGYVPAEVLDALGERVKVVHAKDVVTDEYTPGSWPAFVNAGDGEMDFASVVAAAQRNGVEWVLFENGHAVEPLVSIRDGYEALRSHLSGMDPTSAESDPGSESELVDVSR